MAQHGLDMLTFLPYPDLKQSAKVLDDQRLINQVLEVKWILERVLGKTTGAFENGALITQMWAAHPRTLATYGVEVAVEYGRRFNRNHQYLKFLMETMMELPVEAAPPWLGAEKLHASHRRLLYFKDPVRYGLFLQDRIGLNCCLNHAVWWPSCRSPRC